MRTSGKTLESLLNFFVHSQAKVFHSQLVFLGHWQVAVTRIARRRVLGQRSRAANAWPTPTAIDAGGVMRHALRLPTFLTLLLATAAVNKHEDPHEHAAALKKREVNSSHADAGKKQVKVTFTN